MEYYVSPAMQWDFEFIAPQYVESRSLYTRCLTCYYTVCLHYSLTVIFLYFPLAIENHVYLFPVNCVIQNSDSVTSGRNELTLPIIYHVLWTICAGQLASFPCVK